MSATRSLIPVVTLKIDPAVRRVLPDFAAFAFEVTIPTDQQPLLADIAVEAARYATARAGELNIESLADEPTIAVWRAAYRAMGLKPAKQRSSVEQLARRAAKGAMPSINVPLADYYNAMSVHAMTPMGGYDLDRLRGREITVRPADPTQDQFDPIGGAPEAFALSANILVYGEPSRVLCWALNHRDSVETCLRPDTTRALITAEGVTRKTAAAAETALREMRCDLQSADFFCSEFQAASG